MGSPQDLAGWLAHLDALQPHTMRLGLTRVAAMREALGLHPKCPLIIVGGTNGKGSVCALLEEIYHAAGYRVGCYTSPHLLHYRERIRINRLPLEDEPLCQAFATVAQGPHAAALSYFEFGTLAAVAAFMAAQVDLMILEVGLGGRLDAVNAFDADCAIITSVDLDHQAQLGATREAIGFEKAGIFRAQRPAICADSAPPLSLQTHAHAIGARWLPITKKQSDGGFGHRVYAQQWDAWCENQAFRALPPPTLRGKHQLDNAAAALAATVQLQSRLPIHMAAVRCGLVAVAHPCRFQVLPGTPVVVLDVAHNPHAARALADNLTQMAFFERTIAVMGMMADKDIPGVVAAVQAQMDDWFVTPLPLPRGADVQQIQQSLRACGVRAIQAFETPLAAYQAAMASAGERGRIVVFGSFLTVSPVWGAISGTL